MEWNNSRFQLPGSQSSFLQQPPRPARSRYWCYSNDDDEDEETREAPQHDVVFRSSRYGTEHVLLPPPPPSIPSLKLESSSVHVSSSNNGDNGDNGGMLLQSFSSLGMPQLEESTEFQPFFPSQNSGFSDSAFLQPSQQQPPTLPELQQQPSEQPPPQFGQYPSAMSSYYAPPMPLTPPPPVMQSSIRSAVDYYPESMPTLHSVHSPVPTLPSSFGQHLLQQQPPVPEFEETGDDFDDDMPRDASPVMFSAAMPATPTNTIISAQASLTLPPGGYPTHAMSSNNSLLDYSATESIHDAKKRGGGRLTAPFTSMATVQEPKFSPDKRKLCCVEGCKSQARAFNRCKRHGGSKRCSSPGCTKSVQSRGLCIRHGGGSRCQEPGCSRASQSHGRCKMHGGGRPCIVAGCEKKAHLKRLCRKHGGGAKCCVAGCDKWAQRQGMCMTHSKVVATQPSGLGLIGDAFLDSRKPSPEPSASSSPSLQFFTDNMPV